MRVSDTSHLVTASLLLLTMMTGCGKKAAQADTGTDGTTPSHAQACDDFRSQTDGRGDTCSFPEDCPLLDCPCANEATVAAQKCSRGICAGRQACAAACQEIDSTYDCGGAGSTGLNNGSTNGSGGTNGSSTNGTTKTNTGAPCPSDCAPTAGTTTTCDACQGGRCHAPAAGGGSYCTTTCISETTCTSIGDTWHCSADNDCIDGTRS